MIRYQRSPSSTMRYITKLLKDFENACEHTVMKGSYPPQEFDWVDENYKKCRTKLLRYIKSKTF